MRFRYIAASVGFRSRWIWEDMRASVPERLHWSDVLSDAWI